jgi:signal transduction histidine kinase
MTKNLDSHLRDACQLTSSAWAALADCEKGQWFVEAAHKLPPSKHTVLEKFLAQPASANWLAAGPGDGERSRVPLPKGGRLGEGYLYGFRVADSSEVILVGARSLSERDRWGWQLLAGLIRTQESSAATQIFTPNLEAELAYDLPRAVDRVLSSFMRIVEPQGAWLAIRRGEVLEVSAYRHDQRLLGAALPLDSNRLLRRAHRTLSEVSVVRGSPDWDNLPHPVRRSTMYWITLPLVIGRRLIGSVALWANEEFPPATVKALRELASRVAQPMELIVTFNELTSHLRRLAMLNDFALAVSSAQDLDQIARRVFGYLARSFHTELIAMYLPSMDGRLVREYRNREGRFGIQTSAFAGHRMLPFLRGRILRLNEGAADFKPVYPGARSTLLVPLNYRSQTMGLLSLESARLDAFSQYDEHLMVVIASHLAGLIEYGRLREEAEGRARSLGLIHEVVQQVIGLNDKKEVAQITADLLAQYFAYELATVMLMSGDPANPVLGFGGSRSEAARVQFGEMDVAAGEGVAGRVFRSGQNLLVNSNAESSGGGGGLGSASEMCVALKDGDRILGLVDVQSSQPNAFTNNDLMAMESLAGVLASVVSSAQHYERLQESNLQLRSAQLESQARLIAQQEAESRLVQAAKLVAVGEMAAGIAHELNNPLTTVTGFSELILDETPPDSPHRADLEMVLHEALRARGVVRRLLDFARQGERARAKCDLNEIIEDVLALTRHYIHTSGVQLEVVPGGDLQWVSVDSNQMKQVFLNLVHNAVQAMPTGGNLIIKTEPRLREGRTWATVSIHDSGIGISDKDIDRIFEPFFTTRGTHGGTGLGLSVTYGIVTDHGGTIEVESQPGQGSTFIVWLPY